MENPAALWAAGLSNKNLLKSHANYGIRRCLPVQLR